VGGVEGKHKPPITKFPSLVIPLLFCFQGNMNMRGKNANSVGTRRGGGEGVNFLKN